MTTNIEQTPDIKLSIKQTFAIDSDMEVDAFSKKTDYDWYIKNTSKAGLTSIISYKTTPPNLRNIAQKIKDILDNWQSYRKRATETSTLFSWKNQTKKLIDIYKKFI